MADYLLNRDWNQPIRYPEPAFEILDHRFARYRIGNATIERIWTGARWGRGAGLVWRPAPA